MKSIIHHVKRHGKNVHKHIKKHHKHYIFGAISAALVYKTLALILTTAAITPMGQTFASGTVNTGTEYTGMVLSGDFFINNNDSSTTGLDVTISNNIDGVTHMRFGNTESDRNIAAWNNYSTTSSWTLDDNGTGTKTVYGQFSGYNLSGENSILDLQDDIEYIIETSETNTGSIQTGEVNTGTANTGTVFIADISPEVFNFTDIINANLNTGYFSTTHIVNGINTGATISINGGNYKINSGDRTATNGIINSGDVIQISAISLPNYNLEKEIILSIGDLDIDWSITTQNTNNICDAEDLILENPSSGDVLNGIIDINRSHNNTDCANDIFIVKLRDANTQYITIGTSDYNNTTLNFDSSLLYSGFYNMTGVNSSGDIVVTYTGEHSGINTYYFSGHKLAILNSNLDIMYEGDYFTIDNLKPELSNIVLVASNETGGYIGLDSTITLSFDSTEELSGTQIMILGTYALLQSNSGNHYTYTIDLSTDNTEGNIIYNIEFQDIVGNTGYLEGSNTNIAFDKTPPTSNNMSFINTGELITLNLNTNEDSKINFIYNLSGSNTGGLFESNYADSHTYNFTGIVSDQEYNYTISIKDIVNNIIYIGGTFNFSGGDIIYTNQTINSGEMIVDTGFQETQTETTTDTGTVAETTVSTSSANTFRTEIEKFKTCKDSLDNMTILEVPVRKYKVRLEMPELETSYVRKLVSAFSIVLFERIENAGLTEQEVQDITKEFNNFLVILKLVRDDGNECEQNLSNYYMSKFRKSLIEYNLTAN